MISSRFQRSQDRQKHLPRDASAEGGEIANPSNLGRSHSESALAPTPEIRTEIEQTIKRIKAFAANIIRKNHG